MKAQIIERNSFSTNPGPAVTTLTREQAGHLGTSKGLVRTFVFGLLVLLTVSSLGAYSRADLCSQLPFLCSHWLQYRSDPTHLGNNIYESAIGIKNASTLTVKWSDPGLYAFGDSSPAVLSPLGFPGPVFELYVGTGYGDALAYDAKGVMGCTGGICKPLWDKSSLKNSQFSSPALPSGGGIVFIAGDHTVEARRAQDGALSWTGPYGGNSGYPINSSTAVANVTFDLFPTQAVFVGSTDGHVYAFDSKACVNLPTAANNCTPRWVSQLWPDPKGHAMFATPAVANNMVYIGEASGDGGITAYNAATGKIVWGDHQNVGYVVSSPTIVNGTTYFGGTYYDGAGYLYAYDAATGAFKWEYHASGAVWSSPAYSNGIIYVGSRGDSFGGYVYGIDANTGVFACSANTGGPIGYSSPAVVNGVLYIGSEDGSLYAFDSTNCASSGALPRLLALPLGSGSPINSSPTVAAGMVYVETGDGLFALAPK